MKDFDPDTVFGELAELETSFGGTRTDRAIAFGVVTSFFSYAVYSIAGFDSVACSVFLFFLLGCAAAFFQPNNDETAESLITRFAGSGPNSAAKTHLRSHLLPPRRRLDCSSR